MVKKTLTFRSKGKNILKSIEMFESPKAFSKITSELSFEIMKTINSEPMYPRQIADKLKVDEQKVYYHIRQLLAAGMIEVVGEEMKYGAVSKFFAPTAQAFGFELPGGEEVELEKKTNPKVREFFHEFIRSGTFDGSIIVGSPLPHGPYNTEAKDGYLSSHLAMFIGSLCGTENRFVVKTDTETKAENSLKRNMILIGGLITNTISSDLNEKMKIKFDYNKEWTIKSKDDYSNERDVLLAKIKNPWDAKKSIIIIAGLKAEGTKTGIIALTQQYDKILKNYDKNKDFYCVVRGYDKDGDGKVDDVRVLETI